jgi:predicted component of type VI protein secretion system
MMNQDLREQLAALHAELARTSTVDGETRELLSTLLADITRLLATTRPAPSDSATIQAERDRHSALAERLDGFAVQFEAEHPALSAALRRVVDALGKAGI